MPPEPRWSSSTIDRRPFAVAVLVFAAEAGAVSGVLRKRVFLTLGGLSYSIYMVHFEVAALLVGAAKLLKKMAGIDLFSGPGAWIRRLARDPSSSKDHVLTSTEEAQQLRDDVTNR